MVNASLFSNLADKAELIRGTKVAVGGNAPVMVNSFRREGVRVLLGAQMSEDLRRKIDPEVEGNLDATAMTELTNLHI
jgi:ADP-specific Phosphofructokinase/Glucokinase conserved region